jgi:enoyl-CoA hydratase/carnithine racemase
MDVREIRYEVGDGVCTVTLNRPAALNALTATMLRELIAACGAAGAVRAVIVTGSGRAFCAGADLSAGAGTFDAAARGGAQTAAEHRDGGGRFTLRVFDMKKPVISAMIGCLMSSSIPPLRLAR